jgi:polysaccharide export outer membrane protein
LAGGSTSNAIENVIDEELLGRVVVDLQGIIDGDETANTFVDDGDTLYVPKYSNTIAVVGEVYEPGTFRFEEGLTLDQYVQIAGGTTNYALKKNIYLLKADGSVRFYRSSALKSLIRFDAGVMNGIEAGDAIVIPTNLDYDPPLSRVSAITSVVFQSLTSIAAFLNITKQ